MALENNNIENRPALRNANGEEDGEFLSLSEIWAMIWNNKWWYVASLVVCVFLAGFVIYRTSPKYSRTSKVIVDDNNENSAMKELASFTSAMGGFRGKSGANVYNEMESFTSPDLMSIVVDRLGLETSYVEKQFLRSRELFTSSPVALVQTGDNHASAYSFELLKTGDSTFVIKNLRVAGEKVPYKEKIRGSLGEELDTPVGKIKIISTIHADKWKKPIIVGWVNSKKLAKSYCKKLNVSLSGKESTVLVLTFEDTFPSRAEDVLNTLIDVYNEQWVANKNRSARNTTAFINDRLVVIENELGGVEESLKEYKETHKITDIQSVSEAYLQESTQYSAKSFEVNNQLSVAKFIRDYLKDPQHDGALIPSNLGLDSKTVDTQISEYNQTVLTRDRLMSDSSIDNPLVGDLNNSISALKVAISRSIENLISTLQMQVDKIEAQENAIMARIASTSGQELKLLSIERQQKIKQELYVYLLQKREENEIASLVNVGNTRMVMSPSGDEKPASPNKRMILLVALVMGLGIPFGVFFLINQLDNRVKNRSDVSDLQIPFLAEIPQIGKGAGILNRLRKNMLDDGNTRIVVEASNRNSINEAFRVLRTNLDFMTNQEPGKCHKIMVTSFNPNAGKTFTIMNMAATVALKNSKVLLLDLDLRKGTLGKALEHNKAGISAYLNGKVNDIMTEIQHVKDNLDLITVGSLPPNPAELLVSDRFKTMLDELSAHYDYIFMDCPPVDLVADTAIIAKEADFTVLIIRAGLFDKRALPVVEDMYRSGVYKHMALILNGVDTKTKAYGHYGYGYGYSYGYGYGHGYGYGYGDHVDKDE